MKEKTFIGASLLAALAASLCCILPIVFALAGAGIVGASAFFEAWRPVLLAITFILLGLGFYFAYRKRMTCAPGSACERPTVTKAGRIWLWLATVFVLLFAAFPYYSGPVANFLLSESNAPHNSTSPAATLTQVSLIVEGMTCPSCAKSVENKLLELKGVKSVTASYEKGSADIEFDPTAVTLRQLEKAIQDAGYKVRGT